MLLLYTAGWCIAFIATFQIDHFELFGLHQGYRALKGMPEPEPRFRQKGFYNYVRHPIQTGTLIGLWATPVMSGGHLLFSLGMTLYVLIGLTLEERELVKTLGEVYARYKKEIPMLFPFKKSAR
jgi:methanethiol S-methyltransferase